MTPQSTLELADHCVKCGLCLPHCPTYRATADESESPRGRIALVQGWMGGALPPSTRLFGHLDRCLECRACERACPSGVAWGEILDSARSHQQVTAGGMTRWTRRAALELLSRRTGVRSLGYLAAAARRLGLLRIASWLGLERMKRLNPYLRLAPFLSRPNAQPEYHGQDSADITAINLFMGCISQISQARTLTAAARLLERLGWPVRIPDAQRCCGALFRHNGFPAQADRLLGKNAAALEARPTLVTASACAAELRQTAGGRLDVQEICGFLQQNPWPAEVRFRPLNSRVAVHEPCSHRNQLGQAQAVHALLGRIPGIMLKALPDNAFCCGAAGSYLIQQPEMAQRLLADKLRGLRELQPEILVTTNTGCALHLAAGIREAGLEIEVCHPVDLLDRQLETSAASPVAPAT